MTSGLLLDRHTGRPIVNRDLRERLERRGADRIIRQLERGRIPILGAERNPPLYMDVSNAYSGDELGLPWRDVMGEGVVGIGDLTVTGHATANSIDIAKGSCWVTGDTNVDLQPTYRCYNDAVVNLGINPDPSNPRRVLVAAQITDQGFAGTGRTWALTAIHGTPAASPALPATPASTMPIADITVPTAAASSAAYTITDLRVPAWLGAGGAGAYRNYTPVFTASTTNPVLGTGGSVSGRFQIVGKRVHCYGIVSFGSSGASAGSGNYQITLPVGTVQPRLLGIVDLYGGSSRHFAYAETATTTSFLILDTYSGIGSVVSNTWPWTWANTHFIYWNLQYESV